MIEANDKLSPVTVSTPSGGSGCRTTKDMTEKELLKKRERDAEAAGEGMWRNVASGEWCRVDVTFYPSLKLWITEKSERRETTRAELEKDYATLKL